MMSGWNGLVPKSHPGEPPRPATLHKGDAVIVVGREHTNSWGEGDQKQYGRVIEADNLGPRLARAVAQVRRTTPRGRRGGEPVGAGHPVGPSLGGGRVAGRSGFCSRPAGWSSPLFDPFEVLRRPYRAAVELTDGRRQPGHATSASSAKRGRRHAEPHRQPADVIQVGRAGTGIDPGDRPTGR